MATPNTPSDFGSAVREFFSHFMHPGIAIRPGEENGGHLCVPPGWARVDLEEHAGKHLPHPKRPAVTTTHSLLSSLIAHAQRHKSADTVAYCNLAMSPPTLTVIYDAVPSDNARGAWAQHRAVYPFPLSPQWIRWVVQANGQQLDNASFARLVEDGLADIRIPKDTDAKLEGVTYGTPSQILSLIEGIQIDTERRVARFERRENGSARILFEENHTAKNASGEMISVPGGFLLGIPVFLGGSPYAVPARLRYTVRGGSVLWSVHLHGVQEVLITAAQEAAQSFEQETDVEVFFGSHP